MKEDNKKLFKAEVYLYANDRKQALDILESYNLEAFNVSRVKSTRTSQQNKALHLYFKQVAEGLNELGLDMRAFIRKDVPLSWTTYSVKEYLWKPLQSILTGKSSTTQLDKQAEIDLIYNNLNRILIERTKGELYIPFPTWEIYLNTLQENERNCN